MIKISPQILLWEPWEERDKIISRDEKFEISSFLNKVEVIRIELAKLRVKDGAGK